MYKIETTLTNSSLTTFDILINQIQFVSDNIRLGANGTAKISNYSYSRWYDWTADQRMAFKSAFGPEVDKAIVGWFLTFPANTGFLDLMTYWEDKKMAGKIIAYALHNNQRMCINGIEQTINRGEGVKFSLRVPHEVNINSIKQDWVCIMQC